MKILAWGILLGALPCLVHLIVWVVAPPRNSASAASSLLFGVWVVEWLALGALLPVGGLPLPEGLGAWTHAAAVSGSLVAAYFMTYPIFEVDSPTLVMILAVARAGPQGLDEDSFRKLMGDDRLVVPRLRNLVNERMLVMHDERLQITEKGRRVLGVIRAYRRVIRAGKGG